MSFSGRLFCAVVALGVAVSFVGVPAMAQDAGRPGRGAGLQGGPGGPGGQGMRGGNVVQAALSVSNLTDEQKAKLEKIQAGLQEKMKEAMAGAGDAATSGPAGRGAFANPEFRKVLTDARAEVESILTDEQKKELQEKMPPRRARGEAGQTSGPGEGRRGGRTQ